jgi:predicted nucleic acid-binding protein
MSARRLTLDTNILVYSIDHQAGCRHALAVEIIEQAAYCDCWITLQAVSEFYAAVTRKGKMPPAAAAAQATDWLDLFPCIAASAGAVTTSLVTAAAGRASYWDSLLVATAAEAGCKAILTEDLANGTVLHGVDIINPFAAEGLTDRARLLLHASASP